jgi:PAS domain S-box-containing protein
VYLGWTEVEDFEAFDLRLLDILASHAAVVLDRIEQIEALRKSEEQFRGLFQEAPIGIACVDLEGYVTETNPAFQNLLGLGAEDLRGRHIERFTHEDDIEKTRSHFDDLVSGARSSYTVEKRYRRPDGEVLWGRVTTSLLRQDGDMQVIGMVENINDQKQREAELREAKDEAERMNQLKSAFLANMSHEIRTPLTSILGFAEMIGEETSQLTERFDAPELDSLGEFARLIEKSGRRLMDTLTGILNLSKLEAEEMDLTVEPVDLAGEAEEIAEELWPRAKQGGIELRVDTEGPAWARADESGVGIVLRNLLSNAIKYTGESGQVWVRAYPEEDTAVLEVEDTGIGMDSETIEDLFEPFRQESQGMSREYEGTGLGLTITNQVVEKMKGTIEIDTEKDAGTRFTVRLPVGRDDSEE